MRSQQQRPERAALPHEQMRLGPHRYPVDRYLDESSNKIEMVNIIDNDNWDPEPALRPEDELVLRRLHDMLRTTAEDLRHLSAELNEHRAPKVHVKSQPIPLDDEFNEKVHIEELVNAKFYGHKIIEPSLNKTFTVNPKPTPKHNINTAVQVNTLQVNKKPPTVKKLSIARTRTLTIDEKIDKNLKNRLNNGKLINNKPPPQNKEFIFKYEEPKHKTTPLKTFQIQDMPSINIRSELKVQKVLQLDIFPDAKQNSEDTAIKSNISVVAAAHKKETPNEDLKITLSTKPPMTNIPSGRFPQPTGFEKKPVRKVSKISTGESSGSNVSSDTQHKLNTQRQIKAVIRSSPRPSSRDRLKVHKANPVKKETEKRTHLNSNEWKKRVNKIYGHPITSKPKTSQPSQKIPKHSNIPIGQPEKNLLNNKEYIPYSKLTLGGARVSDVERETKSIPNKIDLPLSPILDKILSSRDSSSQKESPRKSQKIKSPRIFTTSDENLLQEVIDIEKKVTKLDKTIKKKITKSEQVYVSNESNKGEDNDSYADDFDDEQTANSNSYNEEPINLNHENHDSESERNLNKPSTSGKKQDKTYTKQSNLSVKSSVDVFEFIPSVDTQDNATQSNTVQKISRKETQTSPRNERANIQPIHNDLWPVDPRGEIEKMLELEKEFIKKFIVEEYGDLLVKNITKPSTSNENTAEQRKNVSASQKLTQTSPAHVKSVMTSPTRTKTRTTSPFLSLKVDHQTSPMVVVTNQENLTVEVDDDEDGISINLSSPRFNLRLPQTSKEVLSNLDNTSSPAKSDQNKVGNEYEAKPKKSERSKFDSQRKILNARLKKSSRKTHVTSSSSEVENSSEMSSLGEIKLKLKRKYKKRVSLVSESSESSSDTKTSSDLPSGGIIPLRSEGEVSSSVRQTLIYDNSNKISKSEGEASVGWCK